MMRFGGMGMSLLYVGYACFIMLCLTALVVLGIVFLVRYFKRQGQAPGSHGPYGTQNPVQHPSQASIQNPAVNAVNILNERYAKGEITEEEYLRMKNNLKG